MSMNILHKVWIGYKWTVLALLMPCLMLWIIMSGIPPVIRAVPSAVKMLGKSFGTN